MGKRYAKTGGKKRYKWEKYTVKGEKHTVNGEKYTVNGEMVHCCRGKK